MRRELTRRKARFRAALFLAGETMQSWAAAQGVTYGHLRFVLNGERVSPRLDRELDAFISAHVPAEQAEHEQTAAVA